MNFTLVNISHFHAFSPSNHQTSPGNPTEFPHGIPRYSAILDVSTESDPSALGAGTMFGASSSDRSGSKGSNGKRKPFLDHFVLDFKLVY